MNYNDIDLSLDDTDDGDAIGDNTDASDQNGDDVEKKKEVGGYHFWQSTSCINLQTLILLPFTLYIHHHRHHHHQRQHHHHYHHHSGWQKLRDRATAGRR